LKAFKIFQGVPKPLQKRVWDIMEQLPKALKGDRGAREFIKKLRPHKLKADLKDWNSLDLVPDNPNESSLRFLWKKTKDGIKWMLKDTHIK
jgi:hypothetical protein